MGTLKFLCPVSFREVETSIKTDDLTLLQMQRMKLSVWCPHCNAPHQIKATEAFVVRGATKAA
jgi:hypothetical protein